MGLPLFRQLRDDPLALGPAARSKRTDALQPRTKTADRVVQSICPYCAGRLRATREYEVKDRRPHGTEWESLDLETAMDMIADRVIRTPAETRQDETEDGRPLHRTARLRVLRRRHARHRGELPDQEGLLGARCGVDRERGPRMTLLHRSRSGDLLGSAAPAVIVFVVLLVVLGVTLWVCILAALAVLFVGGTAGMMGKQKLSE